MIDVVEAGYRLDLGEQAWLDEIVKVAAEKLDLGDGVIANIVDLRRTGVRTATFSRVSDGLRTTLEAVSNTPPPEVARTFRTERRGFFAMSERFPRDPALHAAWKLLLEPHGFHDGLALIARGLHDTLELWAPAPTSQRTSAQTRRRWDRVAAHFGAAMRLRSAFSSGINEEAAHAIVDPAGRVQHARASAQGTALVALRRAVLGIEKARGALRRENSDAALAMWKGLVDGRWSLVDYFDTDGQRFFAAVPNPVEGRDPRALSEREASVVVLAMEGATPKDIAYTLGIADSNARAALAAALRKLRIPARADLHRFQIAAGDVFEVQHAGVRVDVLAIEHRPEDHEALARLTDAERAIARLAAGGRTDREIARARRASVRTVANQMRAILRKLGIGSRIELGRYIRSQ